MRDKTCFCGEIHKKPKPDFNANFESKCRNCLKLFMAEWHCYPFCSRECSRAKYPHGHFLTEAIIFPGYQKYYHKRVFKAKCQGCSGIMVPGILDRHSRGSRYCRGCYEKECTRKCLYCNKEFIANNLKQRHCSYGHSQAYNTQQKRDRRREPLLAKICKYCGKNFRATKITQVKCRSSECANAYHRETYPQSQRFRNYKSHLSDYQRFTT